MTIDYLAPDVLADGQPCIMAAAPKTLKTSIACDLGISIATGLPFLGKFPVNGTASVVLMCGEGGRSTLQETIRRIARSKGIHGQIGGGQLSWTTELPRLDQPADLDGVARLLKRKAAKLLILDPLYLMLPGGSASNLFAQGELLRGIGDVCQAAGTTLLLVHHTSKSTKGMPTLENLAWAGVSEFARQWLLLGRDASRTSQGPENTT